MSIYMKPFKDAQNSGVSILGSLLKGKGSFTNVEDKETRRPVSFRIDTELFERIDGIAKSARLTKTEVFELLLWDGLQHLDEYMKVISDFED